MRTSFAMANVKVAVRVRPLSKKEEEAGSSFILDVSENVLSIINLKVEGPATDGDRHRQRVRHFTFDFCYLSADRSRSDYASQELVYQDLGTEILDASFAGYNACLFAYGQTGSGKTYTMMGCKDEVGLIPRICEGLCSRVDDFAEDVTCQIEVSYLEIYNERVRDLLAPEDLSQYTLKVREHPKDGPYVQDLSKHLVGDHISVRELIERGNVNRTTAATHMHDASSRSHAIFTINFTQATLKDNMPSEVVSKINLVDLAGSERADPNYSKGRLTEGANINKSLVTLGNCISALGSSEILKASNSLSAASMESLAMAEDNYTASGLPRKPGYIPYRNSVLTWLLKDSLGGNSKTIMISTVSPASTYFNETMSTLRYARRAKHIVNKPKVNEDLNVRLIRELRAEIDSLKALLSCASLSSSQASLVQDKNINEILQENEQKVDRLTEAWVEKWREAASIMQECNVGIRRENVGVIVESDLPHLLGMDDDLLSTGIILYHLKEGETTIGREDADEEQDIILSGPGIEQKHCSIQNNGGTVMLCPCEGALCAVNGLDVNQPTQLTQGAVVLFGKTNMYRFNHPAEAAKLRERRASIQSNPERRVTRKNSITLKVPSSALNEEARQRSMSFSFTRDGNLIEEQDHPNFGSALSPIMMYNSGDDVYMEVFEDIELERQHKMEVEKLDETRKRLAELQEKHREAEEAHQEREEKMRHIYQSHQDMIERQRKTLERLKSEHAQAREDAEEELRQLKAMLLEEKIKGEKKLKEELRILKDELTKKAMTSALDACVLPKVVAMDTETSQHLTELDVDRKRVTQLELLYRESQREAAAELQEKERCMDQQRDEESQAIARAESKLADIENITFPWQRLSSRNSLESLVEETGSYSGESYCSNLDRVSPIGGRSDSDSNSGSLQNGASNNYNNNDKSIEHGSKSCGSRVKNRSNSPVKNSLCNKKQNLKLQPVQKERTSVRNKFVSKNDNRTMKKPAKQMPHKVKMSDHGAKKEDAQKNNPAKVKSSIHDRSPSPLKKISPNIKKNVNKLETTEHKSNQLHKVRSKHSNEPSSNSKAENTVFSRLYKPQTPKFQYLKKKDRPLYGRDWMQPPDRSREYHLSQLRTGMLPSSKTPSPVRAKQIGSPARGRPDLNSSPTPKINGTPRVGRTLLSSKSVPSSKPSSNSPRTKHSTSSSTVPEQRNIRREDSKSAQSCSKNTISRNSSNKSAVSQGIKSANPSNNVIKPTRKSWRRQQIVVSPPKKVSVEYVKPKITKPKQRTPLSMTPRKTKNSESFFVPMKDKVWKAVAIDNNPENNSDYIQRERQPAIGCSRSMEDVTLGHGIPLPFLDGNEENDFVKEQKIASEISSAVDDFRDSLDEDEEFYEDASYTEPLSYHDSDSKNITGESLTLVTANENESDISCDSLDDEDQTQTNHTMTPVSQTKENNPFDPHALESQDFVKVIEDGISDKPGCTNVVKKMKDNSVELEEVTVNVFNNDDRKRKPSLEVSFKDDTCSESESDDEISEHAPPAKKSRRLKKSRNHQLNCSSSESESEDTHGVNLNGLPEVKIEVSDENSAFQCGNAVHVPLDDTNSMSDSSASVMISNNGENSDIDGSLNLSGHGNLSESFNCDILVSKDVLSSEEMPPLTEDRPADNSINQIKHNDTDIEEMTAIETQKSIINNNLKEGTCEDEFTEDSDSDSSSEDSVEGGDYYVSAGIQVKRPLADITEEVQSSENEDTDDSSQSTDTYSSPFSSADEEESNEEKKTYSIDKKKTYNVYDEKEGIFKGEQYSSTDNSESFLSDEEDCKVSESSSEESLQDTCHLTDLKDTADSVIEGKPLYIGFIGLEPSIHICLTPSSSEQDRISDSLPYDPVDSQAYIEEIDVETNLSDKSLPKNLSENNFKLENDELAIDKEKEPPVECGSASDEQCSEKLEDSYLDTTITDEDIQSSVCDVSGSNSYTFNLAPELRSMIVLGNKEQELVTNDSLSNVLLIDKDRNSPEQKPDCEVENILEPKDESFEALDDFVNAKNSPSQRQRLLQVGIQNSSTECESADELPCTEHRLVGQNFAIANAQLKMIALLLGNKSAIYDSDESSSPERMESPLRKVPTSPKTVSSDGFKITPVVDKGISSSISGDVHRSNETVIKSDTVKADRLPQNLALISTFDSPQSPVISHVVAVDHHKGNIVNIPTNITDDIMPDTGQHEQELNKNIKECDKWRESGEIIFAKTDGTRFPPEGNVDSIYSESVSNVSKLTMLEMETQTEEQKSVDQKQVQERNPRKLVCGDYEVRPSTGTQTDAIIPERAIKNINKYDVSTECSSNLILDMNSGISVAMQTDVFQECQEEVSIPDNDNVSTKSESYLENTLISNRNTNNRHMMVSVATLTISDDTSNIEDTERMILEKYDEQNSMTTCDAATSPDYLQPFNENYIFEPTKEDERYGEEHRVPGNKTKNAETQYEDNSEFLSNSSELLHMREEPKAVLQHKMSNEENIINVCDTKDTGTQVQLTDYSAFDILECNLQQTVFTKDEGRTHMLPPEEVIAASTQTNDSWKRSVVCQTDLCEQGPRDESKEVLKIPGTSMAIQTDNCQEVEAIDTHASKKVPSACNKLDSETPTFSDSGIQVYIADENDHFKSGRTSCHTCQDEYLFNDNVPSLVNQGIQTEPILLDISSEVNNQSIESEPAEIILEEEMPVDELEDICDHHPRLDSEMSVESEVDAEESSVVPTDASRENDDLQFLERIKEMKDKAQHVASRARMFTSKLRLSNMNDSAESLDHHSDGMPQDTDFSEKSTNNSLEAEERISTCSSAKSSNADDSEIEHTSSREGGNRGTKRSELKSFILNTEAKTSTQIAFTLEPELSLVELEKPLENTSSGSNDDGYDDVDHNNIKDNDDKDVLMYKLTSDKTNNKEMSTEDDLLEHTEVAHISYGYESNDNITSQQRMIQLKSQAIVSKSIACTLPPESFEEPLPESFVEPVPESASPNSFTKDILKHQGSPSHNLETGDNTGEETEVVNFAHFKLMLCEQYVQQKMVLSEVRSFWQQLKEEEEEEKVKDTIQDENPIPKLADICEVPKIENFADESQKVSFNHQEENDDQAMDIFESQIRNKPTGTIIYHVDEEIIRKPDGNTIQPHMNHDSNNCSNAGNLINENNTDETMKMFEDVEPATASMSEIISSSTDENDGSADQKVVDSPSDLSFANEDEISCDSIDCNKIVSQALKYKLHQLPTINYPPDSNDISDNDENISDGGTKELQTSEQYVWSKNPTTNKTVSCSQSSNDHSNLVNSERDLSTDVLRPDLHMIHKNEDLSLNELARGKPEQHELISAEPGYHYHLKGSTHHISSHSQKTRFLEDVDKQVVNLPTYNVNFDLDESDEDLRALKKSHEDVERILEETSSPDSDLEDSAVEPELVALMEEIENDHISADLAKERLDPPSLTENRLCNHALKIPVSYRSSNDSQNNTPKNSCEPELDNHSLEPQDMRINVKPLSPFRPDWLTESVLENGLYNTSSNRYLHVHRTCSPSGTNPVEIDRLNSLEMVIQEKGDILKVTERSSIQMKYQEASSYNSSPYQSGISTPKSDFESPNVNHIGKSSSLTVENLQAIGALPKKFLSKTSIPLEAGTDVEILSDFQDEIPKSNTDVSGREKQRSSTEVEQEDTEFCNSVSAETGNISDVLSDIESFSDYRTINSNPPHNSLDAFSKLKLAMDSNTQTDVPSDTTSLLQDDITEVDQALSSSDSDQFHIGIASPGSMLDRHDTSVELMEAKMMHGIGETDAWLRFLESDNSLSDWMQFKKASNHEKKHDSIGQKRKESLERPHTSNGHYTSPLGTLEIHHLRSNSACMRRDLSPVGRSRQPSRQLEYLQKLRQDVVKATSQTETASENSGIDELLAEYQRTREQSQAEITKAKEKLKQQTKKEKQRLKDEMKYLRDIENQTMEARIKAEDHIRDERKRIFLEERQLLRIKDWSHRRTSSEQDVDIAIMNLKKARDSTRYNDILHGHPSQLNRTWHGTPEESKRSHQPLPNYYVSSVHRQSFSDRSSVASGASSGRSFSPPSTDRSNTRSSLSIGSDRYVGSPVSDVKSSSPEVSYRNSLDYHHSSFSTDDELSPRYSYELSRPSGSFHGDVISANSLKNAKIKMMADPMLVEARYKESLERIKRYEKSSNFFHGHHQRDRRGRSREHTRSYDERLHQVAGSSPDASGTPHRRAHTFDEQVLQPRQVVQQDPNHNYRNYQAGVGYAYRDHPPQIPPVVATGDSDWEY